MGYKGGLGEEEGVDTHRPSQEVWKPRPTDSTTVPASLLDWAGACAPRRSPLRRRPRWRRRWGRRPPAGGAAAAAAAAGVAEAAAAAAAGRPPPLLRPLPPPLGAAPP